METEAKCPFCKAVVLRETYLSHHQPPLTKFLCGTRESGDMPDRWIRSVLCEVLQSRDALAAENAALRELLKGIEFVPDDYDFCPSCQHRPLEHAPDCKLAALLKD